MSIQKILFFICLLLSLLAVYAGIRDFNMLPLEIAAAVYTICFGIFRKKAGSLFLVVSTGIAAAGIILKAQPVLMILYAGLSLVCWELAAMENLPDNKENKKSTELYMTIRLGSLLSVFAAGFLTIYLCRFLSFNISFYLILLISIAAFVFMFLIFKLLRKKF